MKKLLVLLLALGMSLGTWAEAAPIGTKKWVSVSTTSTGVEHIGDGDNRRVDWDVYRAADRSGAGTLIRPLRKGKVDNEFLWIETWAEGDEVFMHWYLVKGYPYDPTTHELLDEGGDPVG